MREYIEIMDNAGDELSLPARRILCPECNGDGNVCHPAFAEQSVPAEEFWYEWDDFEREMYLGGGYDVVCPECKGRCWVLEVDETSCTIEEIEAYRDYVKTMSDMDAMIASERRYGA